MHPTTIHATASAFVGRAEELAALTSALERAQVVLVTGPPGVGKTALARASLREVEDVRWCSVAAGDRLDAVVDAMCEALEVPIEKRGRAALGAVLRARTGGVLVLDDLGPLGQDLIVLERLCQEASPCKVVITSRQHHPLYLMAHVHLEPMRPEDAVELLRQRISTLRGRAHEASPDDLGRLAAALDHLPLAIELAATRANVLSPAMMLERLEARRFQLLRSQQGALERSLRWTWEMLDPAARACAAQCSLLDAGFDLDAAEAIVALPDDADLLDALDALVAHSWVQSGQASHAPGTMRFTMLASIRAFGARELEDAEFVRARAARHYAQLAGQHAPALTGPQGLEALATLSAERANLLVALETLASSGPLDDLAEMLWSLRWYLTLREPPAVYRRWLERALGAPGRAGDGARILAAQLAIQSQDHGRALEVLEDVKAPDMAGEVALLRAQALEFTDVAGALSVLEAAPAPTSAFERGRRLTRLGYLRCRQFELVEAEGHFWSALEELQLASNPLFLGDPHTGLAYIGYRRGEMEASIEAFGRALSMYEQIGNRDHQASAHFNLSYVLHVLGEEVQARAHLEAALAGWRALGRESALPLAMVRSALLDRAHASETLREAMRAAMRLGDTHHLAHARGLQVILHLNIQETAQPEGLRALEQAAHETDPQRAPDACAAFWGALAEQWARHGELGRADESLGRLGSLRAMISWEDVYMARLLERLDATSRALVDRARPQLRALLKAGDAEAPSPWLRLALERARRFLDEGPGARDWRLRACVTGDWFEVAGQDPVLLRSRHPQRRMLAALIAASPEGRGIDVAEMIEVGWPGEFVSPGAGANRVYTSVRALRSSGLEGILLTSEDGYVLDPEGLEITDEPTPDGGR